VEWPHRADGAPLAPPLRDGRRGRSRRCAPGRPAAANAAYRRAAETALETPPRALGLPFDVWTSARLSAYLTETTGVRIAPGWLRALLGQWDYVCGRPKHTLKHLQDPVAVAACVEELAAAASKSGRCAGAVRVPS
jgi:Winged helix-turn helix